MVMQASPPGRRELPTTAETGAIAWWDGTGWQFTTVAEILAKSLGAEDVAATDSMTGGTLGGGTLMLSNAETGDAVEIEPDGTTTVGAAERSILNIPSADVVAAAAGTSGTAPSSANKFVDNADLRLKQSLAALTDAADVTPDFATSNNFELGLTTAVGSSRNLKNPVNPTVGQSGVIYLVQDGTGNLAIVFDTHYKFAGGVKPGLSTAAGAVDRLVYLVRSSTFIDCVLGIGLA